MAGTVVSLRYATAEDDPFLEHLFRATRTDDVAGLDEAKAAELLGQQFHAQRRALAARFDPAGDHIITEHDVPVGRLWVHCAETEWELVDIAVLPERQHCGIATVLVNDLVTQADANDAALYLFVRVENIGAQRLYHRHGFEVDTFASTDTDLRLKRSPTP
jgi:ribosomal protein S18 acetylase RimI-like enzyme